MKATKNYLAKMIAEAPNGSEAAQLLERLIVFVSTFDQGAIAPMSQDLFSPSERRAAFATLRDWGFVMQIHGRTDRRLEKLAARMMEDDFFGLLESALILDQEIVEERFMLAPDPDLVHIVPRDPQAEALHYQHYLTLYQQFEPTERDKQLINDWQNVARALDWGYRHQQDTMQDFYLRVHAGLVAQIDSIRGARLARYACKMAQRTNNSESATKLLEILGQHAEARHHARSARHYYSMALAFYQHYANFFAMTRLLELLIKLSAGLNDYQGERRYHEQMLSLYQASPQREQYTRTLLRLKKLAMDYHDLPSARHYAHEVMTSLDFRNRNTFEVLRDLAQFFAEIGDRENARDCYASAYAIAELNRTDTLSILNIWSDFEHTHGHIQMACRLLALIISDLQLRLDQWAGSNEMVVNELHALLARHRKSLTAMQGDGR